MAEKPAEKIKNLSSFKRKLKHFKKEPSQVIPLLQMAQETCGYISPQVIKEISDYTCVSCAQIYGVATFYAQFRFTPVGKYLIKVCHGTACHVAGANAISEAITEEIGIDNGQTTSDGRFTLELVSCLGCCSLAPVIMINEDTHGRLTQSKVKSVIKQYQ